MTASSDRDDDHSGSRFIPAPARIIYRALLDPEAIAAWRAPDGMTCSVHELEPRVGGRFRIELRYGAADSDQGKSGENVDRLEGAFAELVPERRVVEVVEFDSDDPAYSGRMRVTTTLKPVAGGTEVRMFAENVPEGITAADHRAGIASTLENLERYLADETASHPLADLQALPDDAEDR